MLASAQLFILRVFYCFCLLFTVDLICNNGENLISSLPPKLISYFTVDLTLKEDIYQF